MLPNSIIRQVYLEKEHLLKPQAFGLKVNQLCFVLMQCRTAQRCRRGMTGLKQASQTSEQYVWVP